MDDGKLKALAAAFREGDEESFRILMDTLSRTLMAMAYRYTEDWDWARDLTQETWIRVHDRIRTYDPKRSFTAWLHTVHRNGCLDHLRRPFVKREVHPGDEALEDWSGAAQEDPQEDLERREFHERILRAARELSETQRQVFVRVDLEQGSQKEVARELGIKPGTLRATLHFARKRMAATLRESEAGA